jgi:hypothetical protein
MCVRMKRWGGCPENAGRAGGTADVGVLLHDLIPGTRITKTVKDVPGGNVRDVLALDTRRARAGEPAPAATKCQPEGALRGETFPFGKAGMRT